MRIKGKKLVDPNRDVLVIPRGNAPDIALWFEAILDYEPFTKMCPLPKPPIRKIKDEDIPNFEDKDYIKRCHRYAEKKMAWMILTSLKATDDLEWEQVDLSRPDTWMIFRKELGESGFTNHEIDLMVAKAVEVNGLSEMKLEAAREAFFRARAEHAQTIEVTEGEI